jgi:hypothetical protein
MSTIPEFAAGTQTSVIDYAINEFPNTEDREVLAFCKGVQEIRRETVDLFRQVVCQTPPGAGANSRIMCWAILGRMNEGSLSCELLAIKSRVRDLAILVLSLYELQLDLRYVAMRTDRIDTWIVHAKRGSKPWRVRKQQDEIFSDPAELKAEAELYEQYSMVKHCNPAAETFGFLLAARPNSLILDASHQNTALICVHLFLLGNCMVETGLAAMRILAGQGFDFPQQEKRFRALGQCLATLNEDHVVKMLAAEDSLDGQQATQISG